MVGRPHRFRPHAISFRNVSKAKYNIVFVIDLSFVLRKHEIHSFGSTHSSCICLVILRQTLVALFTIKESFDLLSFD